MNMQIKIIVSFLLVYISGVSCCELMHQVLPVEVLPDLHEVLDNEVPPEESDGIPDQQSSVSWVSVGNVDDKIDHDVVKEEGQDPQESSDMVKVPRMLMPVYNAYQKFKSSRSRRHYSQQEKDEIQLDAYKYELSVIKNSDDTTVIKVLQRKIFLLERILELQKEINFKNSVPLYKKYILFLTDYSELMVLLEAVPGGRLADASQEVQNKAINLCLFAYNHRLFVGRKHELVENILERVFDDAALYINSIEDCKNQIKFLRAKL